MGNTAQETSTNEPYYEGAAIVIIVANCISLLSLGFVITMYIINWRSMASFPMRLVQNSLK